MQTNHVFRIDGILKELASHLKERRSGEQTVGSSLVLWPYPWHLRNDNTPTSVSPLPRRSDTRAYL